MDIGEFVPHITVHFVFLRAGDIDDPPQTMELATLAGPKQM